MKKLLSLLLCAVLLTGCDSTVSTRPVGSESPESQSDAAAEIILSDNGITVNGGPETDSVFTSHDIVYYEDRDVYDSGNPYGEGTDADKHTAEEAAAHTVVNITAPGAYRITGKLSAGQIRIDLGEDACENPNAVVKLILDNADITCTVAPAILFLNVYECDGNWSTDSAKSDVDTSAAGANLILEGENTVNGSYVAKIFKDKDGEKKLWKQDGAVYSYMSMNVFGPGSLDLTAANEGLDTELHLTLNGGNIRIFSGNDGINTNEDGVSVTTINSGNLTIFAGLGAEGDGIDSNGYLVVNGGTVVASANPGADAGLDSDLGSYVNGGTVIAFGSTMDWAESESGQVTMNLQFAQQQAAGSEIRITAEDGSEVFAFAPDGEHVRTFSGMILSHPAFVRGETYHVYVDGMQMAYSGTDVRGGPGMGRHPGAMQPGEMPEGFEPGKPPENFDPSKIGGHGHRPEGNMIPPEGFDGEMPPMPEGMEPPAPAGDETFPKGEIPHGGFGDLSQSDMQTGNTNTAFYMNDMVNCFSGVTTVQ